MTTFSYDVLDAADYEMLKEIADEIHAALRHRSATLRRYVNRFRPSCDLNLLADHLDALADELDPPSATSPDQGAQKTVSLPVLHNSYERQTSAANSLAAESELPRRRESTLHPDANQLGAQKTVSQPAAIRSPAPSDPGAQKTVSETPPESISPPRFIDSGRNPLAHNRFDMSDFYAAVIAKLPLQPRRQNLPRPPFQPPPQATSRQPTTRRSRGNNPAPRDRHPPPARPPP